MESVVKYNKCIYICEIAMKVSIIRGSYVMKEKNNLVMIFLLN